jgi:hypothetical protein
MDWRSPGQQLLEGRSVWPIREVEFKPPFPVFNSAITGTIQQCEFEPLFIQGKPVPVCLTVAVNIDWQ